MSVFIGTIWNMDMIACSPMHGIKVPRHKINFKCNNIYIHKVTEQNHITEYLYIGVNLYVDLTISGAVFVHSRYSTTWFYSLESSTVLGLLSPDKYRETTPCI